MLEIVTVILLGLLDFKWRKGSNACFQFAARLESDNATIRDADFAVRLVGIAANFRFGDSYLKGAEGAEGDVVALLQAFADHLDECIDEGGHFRLSETYLIAEIRYNFAFRDGSHDLGGVKEMPSYKDYASIN